MCERDIGIPMSLADAVRMLLAFRRACGEAIGELQVLSPIRSRFLFSSISFKI